MLLLNNDDVAKVLDMPLCLAALDGVFQEMVKGEAVGMGRIDLYVPSGETPAPYYRWAVMTGGSKKDGLVCARMLSDMVTWPREYGRIRENKYAREPGTFLGLLFLFSAQDAHAGRDDQRRLPAAPSRRRRRRARREISLAARRADRRHDRLRRHGAHLSRRLLQVRKIKKVKVWSPNADNVRTYAREMAERHGVEVEVAHSAREAVRGVDIVSCCTSTNEPVFFNDWLEPGMHVTNLTSSEIEPSLPRIVDVAMRAGEATPRLEKLPPEADYYRAGFLGYVAGTPEERAIVPQLTLPPEIIGMPRLVDLIAGKARAAPTRSRPRSSSMSARSERNSKASPRPSITRRARKGSARKSRPTGSCRTSATDQVRSMAVSDPEQSQNPRFSPAEPTSSAIRAGSPSCSRPRCGSASPITGCARCSSSTW